MGVLNQKKDKYDVCLLIILSLIVIERILFVLDEGIGTFGGSDDLAYVEAGMIFARTGKITIWSGENPSAMAMPFVAFFFGIQSFIFGDGALYVGICKLFYIAMATTSVYVTYKIVTLFLPKWCGILSALFFLLPNFAWSDKILSTETPYILFTLCALYYTLLIGTDFKSKKQTKNFILYALFVTLALTVRANAIVYPVFTLLYLIIGKKIPIKALKKLILITVSFLLIFIIPWAIRNYIYFHDFTPITDGAGNPNYEGTFFEGCPPEDAVDYSSIYEKYYSDPKYCVDGQFISPAIELHVHRLMFQEKAILRVKYWISHDLKGFITAYFIKKPIYMVTSVWYWDTPYDKLHVPLGIIYRINLILCMYAPIDSIIKRKFVPETVSLFLLYWIQVFITCLSYACERYNSMLMPIRNILAVFAIYFIYLNYLNIKKKRGADK